MPVNRLRLLTLTIALACAGSAGTAVGAGTALNGSWVGTYTIGRPAQITVAAAGRRATVALGVGHAGVQAVRLSATGGRVRFRLPGAPPLVFSGRLAGRQISGTVTQGPARGSFTLRRGAAPELIARGLYSAGGRTLAVVDDPYGPARLLDLDSGEVHALYPSGKGFVVGSGFAARSPTAGPARFDAGSAHVGSASAARVRVRELEVRFASSGAVLSGTLTLPPGAGPHPAVAWVHGSGPTTRAYLPDLQALLLRHGVAVLAYDKRGIGQSGGGYPGESPTDTAIDVLARDAAAAVRFLAARPEIHRTRVGLAGHSQAGWIIPPAASREAAVRFAVIFSGPAVTADENDLYQDLSGQGERAATLSDDAIDAEVLRQGPGGVDPIPWIRQLRVPALWLYGGLDRHIPPRISARRLEPIAAEPGRDFTIATFARANHALVETQTGLTSEMLASNTFAPGLFARVGAWLRAHGLAAG
jgi:dienelactone hydrolase